MCSVLKPVRQVQTYTSYLIMSVGEPGLQVKCSLLAAKIEGQGHFRPIL